MKFVAFLIAIGGFTNSVAQINLQSMIAAERSFAADAVKHSTKEAFLKFIGTGAIMFANGEAINGYQLWSKKEKNNAILFWWPAVAEIAASGDFGYTAGPWTYKPGKKDSIVANGYFFTVWKKNKAGKWKFILDVGTDAGVMMKDEGVKSINVKKTKGDAKTMRLSEEAYVNAYKKNEPQAAQDFFSKQIINVSADKPALFPTEVTEIPTKPHSGLHEFTYLGGGIAKSGDLGYTYGSFTNDIKGKKENYLRIWRHENGAWKIALQMLRW